ncbi:MAG TPA: hypothetical protein VH415_01740 [Nitrososphaeraceae archaeon]|jgi:hypothetical protein
MAGRGVGFKYKRKETLLAIPQLVTGGLAQLLYDISGFNFLP